MELTLLCVPAVADLEAVARHVGSEAWDVVAADPGTWESAAMLAARLGRSLEAGGGADRLVADNPGRKVLLVCEAHLVRDYVAAVLDLDPDLLPAAEPGALTRVRVSRRGHRNLISLNDRLHLDHLPAEASS